jgi:DNA-binding beta-propeller fold protein YncE
MMIQNGLIFSGDLAATGSLPLDLAFSPDGKILYVANNGGNTISIFSHNSLTLNLLQTVTLPVQGAESRSGLVRIRLSDLGNRIAGSTFDGRLFLADIASSDGTVSNVQEITVANGANLEEVLLDANGQTVYMADQDNGGIYGYSLGGFPATPLPGFPLTTPAGPTGMAMNGAGDRLYVIFGPAGQIFTFVRDKATGGLTATVDAVGTGGFLANKIVRVPAH